VGDGLWRTAQLAHDGQVVTLQSHLFSLQGPHRIEIRGRVAGNPATTDKTPAVLELVIDTEAPELSVTRTGSMLQVSAYDRVWSADRISIELLANGEVIAEGLGALEAQWPAEAQVVSVRAQDGSGLVVSKMLALATIESLDGHAGLPLDLDAVDTAQGCSCDALSLSSPLWLAPLLALRRRRRRRSA
jgi:hypothetical protein